MSQLVVLLTCSSEELVETSIKLQRVLAACGTFKINYQSGAFAQFLVETTCCAKHVLGTLTQLGFNVEVSQDEEFPTQSKEVCHDCQTMAA